MITPAAGEGTLLLVLEWTVPLLLQDSGALKALTLVSHAVSAIAQPCLLRSMHQLRQSDSDPGWTPMIPSFISELEKVWRPASFVHTMSFSLESGPYMESLRDISSILSRLPNLQNISVEISSPVSREIDLTALFSGLLQVQRRTSLDISIDGRVTIAHMPIGLLRDAARGLRSLRVSLAEELGTPQIQALLDGACPTLQTLSVPFPFLSDISLETLRFPRLESFTYLDDGEFLDIAPFLGAHSALTTLALSGRFESAFSVCPNVISLTLDAELPTKQIEMDLFSLPSRGILRELHLSLIESASELDLQDVFSSLFSLEDLTISGWFSRKDCGISYIIGRAVGPISACGRLREKTIKAYARLPQVFPSLRTLEVYYSPLRLVSIPAYPEIMLYRVSPQPADWGAAGWGDFAARDARSQQAHVTRWATLAIPELVRGLAALVHLMPLKRIRWVPCHYQAYSDDVDIIVRRDEGRVRVEGGFRRTLLQEEGISKWKWDKLASTNLYTGPWDVAAEAVVDMEHDPSQHV